MKTIRPSVSHFGEHIRRQRKLCGLTLQELAEKAGISKGNLSKIENGGDPKLSTVKMLCNALGLCAMIHVVNKPQHELIT